MPPHLYLLRCPPHLGILHDYYPLYRMQVSTGGLGSGEFEEIWRNWRNGLVDHGGREVENSKKFGEIGEIGWPTTMGVGKWRIRRNMEKSEKWAGRSGRGSGNGEFEEIWRNRGNRMPGAGHRPMFIKTLPYSNLEQHTETPRYKTTHIFTVRPYRTTLRT